jgi:tetratricopeptide (TPR) repeat protein
MPEKQMSPRWPGLVLFVLFALALNLSPRPLQLDAALSEARQLVVEGQPGFAAQRLQTILDYEPWRVELWEQAGTLALSAGNTQQAVKALNQAWQSGRITPGGLALLGDALQKQQNLAEAVRAYQAAVDTGRAPVEIYARVAGLWRELNQPTEEESALRAWLTVQSGNLQATLRLALLIAADKPDEAVKLVEPLVRRGAVTSVTLDRLSQAARLAASQENPAYKQLVMGRALGGLGQWQLAERAFVKAVLLEPEYAEAWAFLGEARQQLGQSGKDELENAQKLNPRSSIVQALLAVYYRRSGQPEKAVELILQAVKFEPTEATWQVELGHSYADMRQLTEALAAYQKAAELEPLNPLVWQALARFSLTYTVQVTEVGLPAAREAVILTPDDPVALDLMGWVMLLTDDSSGAERFLQRALERDATFATAHLHLAQTYLQQAKMQEAWQHLQRVIELAGTETEEGLVARRLLARYFGGQ